MPFLVYRRKNNESTAFEFTEKHFKMGGRGIIYNLWHKLGKPLNKGWHITADDMVKQWSNGKDTRKNIRLLIDFDPRSKERIGIVEPLDIYAYTTGVQNNPV